jgi:hypothetical protein
MTDLLRPLPRDPHRFVPTLTEVVPPGLDAPLESAAAIPRAPIVPVPVSPFVPFVPTLTEVVLPDPPVSPVEPPAARQPAITEELLADIVDAALRRSEAALNQRLPEALAVILHEQALAMSEHLRREIRAVVKECVSATLTDMLPDPHQKPVGPRDNAIK